MLKPILCGIVLIGITVIFHAWGTLLWLRHLVQRFNRSDVRQLKRSLPMLTQTVFALILLHVCEIALWASAYIILPDTAGIITVNDALYFSFVTFTTIGYGDITLLTNWRLLSGIEGINGIILCGWSTAVLFSILQGIWSRHFTPPADAVWNGRRRDTR